MSQRIDHTTKSLSGKIIETVVSDELGVIMFTEEYTEVLKMDLYEFRLLAEWAINRKFSSEKKF